MATLFELKDEILKGRRVKREWWGRFEVVGFHTAILVDIFADDWILEPLPKEKKKVKLYAYLLAFSESRVGAELIFVRSPEYVHEQWTRLPNLDQEIEVDDC